MTNKNESAHHSANSPTFWLLALMDARERYDKTEAARALYELAQQGIYVTFGIVPGPNPKEARHDKRS